MEKNTHFSGRELRRLRQESGYTQKTMARRLGVSRETVVALENEYPSAIGSVEARLIQKWFQITRNLVEAQTRKSFMAYVVKYFNS